MQGSLVVSKIHKERKEGIIRKHQGRWKPDVFISSPTVVFGEDYSLTLLKVTPEASGSYECALNAKIGGQNIKVIVDLVVNGELLACSPLPQKLHVFR